MKPFVGSVRRGRSFSVLGVDRAVEVLLLGWMGLLIAGVVRDQIDQMPLRPPTPVEIAAVMPRARADWSTVYTVLARRSRWSAPEFGAVWATRSGRLCGLVNIREAGVDSMTQFYTVGAAPILRYDDERRFVRDWLDCIDDHWIVLRDGTQQTGFCASPHGRRSVLGQDLCRGR